MMAYMKRAGSRPGRMIFAPLLTLLVFSLPSCSNILKSPVVTPTATSALTPTPTQTPTVTPTAAYTEWPQVVMETFDEPSEAWHIGEVNSDLVKGTVKVDGGKLYVKLTAKKSVFYPIGPEMDDLLDEYVSVKVDQWDGSKTAEYGIVLRANSGSMYFFGISTVARGYRFLKSNAETGWEDLTLWTNNSGILPGEPNRIAVKALGPQFAFFINGEAVDDAKDNSSAAGIAGVGIMLAKAGDWVEMTFDNFEVRAPLTD
jgi:hypothetical protein